VFMDAPLVFDDANLESQYRPDNDNNRYNGPTRLREALYRSINLVSMRTLLEIGAGRAMSHVAKFGFDTTDFPRNTQLAIGGGTMAVTPIDMARAYAVLANGGYLIEPYIIQEITNGQGRSLYRAQPTLACSPCQHATPSPAPVTVEPSSLEALLSASEASADASSTPPAGSTGTPSGEGVTQVEAGEYAPASAPRVVDERNTFIMHSMLQDVIKRGTGRSARRLRRNDLAGKTGTTNDAADTWFNGYHPHLVTSVWVGFGDHSPLGARAYGSNTPLPIWIDYMEDALAGEPEVFPKQPPGVVTLKIDPVTGALARPGQDNALFEYFFAEHAPTPLPADEPPKESPTEPLKAIDIFSE